MTLNTEVSFPSMFDFGFVAHAGIGQHVPPLLDTRCVAFNTHVIRRRLQLVM